MTMPDKIWVTEGNSVFKRDDKPIREFFGVCENASKTVKKYRVSYTRTDIADARIAELEAEVDRFRASLAMIAARPLGGVLEDYICAKQLQEIARKALNGEKP